MCDKVIRYCSYESIRKERNYKRS